MFIHRLDDLVVIQNEYLDFSLWNKIRDREGDAGEPVLDDMLA